LGEGACPFDAPTLSIGSAGISDRLRAVVGMILPRQAGEMAAPIARVQRAARVNFMCRRQFQRGLT
jgi:hypothetical protein